MQKNQNRAQFSARNGVFNVGKDDILAAIENLREEVNTADLVIRKRVIQTLFDEIRVLPKEEERYIELRGINIALTRVNVAPRPDLHPDAAGT